MASSKILITFYSRNGSTEALAKAMAEGAIAAGAEVRLRRVPEIVSREVIESVPGWAEAADRMINEYGVATHEDFEWADGIAFGSPTRFGNVTAELKAQLDSLGGLWFQGKLYGKAATVFTATSTNHGGNESTILSLFNVLSHFGFVIVPIGFGTPLVYTSGSPYGATAVVAHGSAGPNENELEVAKYQGKLVANVAAKLSK